MITRALDIKRIAVFMLAILFFIFDRLLKLAAVKADGATNILGKFIRFKLAVNEFIALSLPIPDSIIVRFTILAIIIGLMLLLYRFVRQNNNPGVAGCLFLICGAASNLADRFAYGWVIDYIEIQYFTIFNLADALVILGALLLFWALFKKID